MLDTFYREFDHGCVPQWHDDVVDIDSTYLAHPRHTLVVAVLDEEVVGTTALNSRGPTPPAPSPAHRALSFGAHGAAPRMYVRPDHRGHGLARGMVRTACEFAAGVPGYDAIHLHTNVDIPGAEAFWRSMADEVCDARTTGEHGGYGTVHFEIPIPVAATAGRPRT